MTFRPTRSRRMQIAWLRAQRYGDRWQEKKLAEGRSRMEQDRPLLEEYDRRLEAAGLKTVPRRKQ